MSRRWRWWQANRGGCSFSPWVIVGIVYYRCDLKGVEAQDPKMIIEVNGFFI
jgi:hypothetical protein